MAYIYVITNNINGKTYVGQTATTIANRWRSHVNSFNRFAKTGEDPTNLKRAMLKYGIENFSICMLYECEESELDSLEEIYIELMDSRNSGYNMTTGGGGTRGHKWSEESRRKLSESISGEKNVKFGKPLPEYVKAKLSESLSGSKNPFSGKTHTDEAKRKISEAHLGKVLSDDHKRKLSESRTGEKNHRFGKSASPLAKERCIAACSKTVNIEGVEYSSIKEACKVLDTSWHTIQKYLRGELGRISVEYEGSIYTSVNALAKHLGLPIVKVCSIIGKGRWDK